MASDDKNWMNLEEVLDHIMRSTGCSRRAARKKLAHHVKRRELTVRHEELPVPKPLSGSEAAEAFQNEPESVLIPLGELVIAYNFTPAELLGELRSGRLIVGADEHTYFALELDMQDAMFRCTVTGLDLLRWMTNPKTPPHLAAKISEPRPIH